MLFGQKERQLREELSELRAQCRTLERREEMLCREHQIEMQALREENTDRDRELLRVVDAVAELAERCAPSRRTYVCSEEMIRIESGARAQLRVAAPLLNLNMRLIGVYWWGVFSHQCALVSLQIGVREMMFEAHGHGVPREPALITFNEPLRPGHTIRAELLNPSAVAARAALVAVIGLEEEEAS